MASWQASATGEAVHQIAAADQMSSSRAIVPRTHLPARIRDAARPTRSAAWEWADGGKPRRTRNALGKVALPIPLRGQWTDHVSRSNALVRVSMVKLLRSRQALFWLANSPGTRIAFSLGNSRIQRTEATYSVMSSSLSTLWW
jgi:hypothetical protein